MLRNGATEQTSHMLLDTSAAADLGEEFRVSDWDKPSPPAPRERWLEIERERRAYYRRWTARMGAALAVVYGNQSR